MTDRREFIVQLSLGSAALLAGQARAAAPLVAETDPQAVALGYKSVAASAAKSPKFVAGAHCGNCALFQGKAGDAVGPCPLYAGKAVPSGAWCSAWTKKA